MRTLILFIMLTAVSFGQEGIPKQVGSGLLPPGLEGETDVKAITKLRIASLQLCVDALQSRYEGGLDNVNLLLGAQLELATAQLESTTVKQERLDYMESALRSSLLVWQRVKALQKVGARGADTVAEAQALAAVYKFRLMWLKEKASNAAN